MPTSSLILVTFLGSLLAEVFLLSLAVVCLRVAGWVLRFEARTGREVL